MVIVADQFVDKSVSGFAIFEGEFFIFRLIS